ncbi:peptidylprolyl isomerase [Pseudoxanthomonas wuyuanensis]|uniref:peptidylprolyl isomerase n=1 Tax=Pseudoxanthomonas wuyuanensis TaxID=1073196 RepID=UPI003CCD4207
MHLRRVGLVADGISVRIPAPSFRGPAMRLRPALFACALLLAPLSLSAQEPPKYRSAQEILDASPASDWRMPDPANTLYMELAGGRGIIELAPSFAPEHVANIRTLAREGFWDGLGIYRSQDNFVVQFGDADAEDAAKAKPLGSAKAKLPAEFSRDGAGLAFTRLADADGWAPEVGFVEGFPAARDPKTGQTWLAHCYGALGAGRGNEADSSNGSELYVVTGQSPRQLDRNITLVGRVVKGMELLSAIPRGPEPMGFYQDAAQRTPITAIRLASDVPEAERTPLQLLRTDSKTFADATEARRNRRDGWYLRPAGHIDLCNVPLPARAP